MSYQARTLDGLLEDEIAEMYAFLELSLRVANADLPSRGLEKF